MTSNKTIRQSPDTELDNFQYDSFPPGFIGALARAIYKMAVRPVREVAIAAALAIMAGICGKAWATAGRSTGLNLYIILIARSAIGKEALHEGIVYFYKAAIEDPNIFTRSADFFCFEECASSPALIKMLKDRHSVVNVLGEFGHIWAALVSRRASSNEVKLRGQINRQFTASGQNSRVGGVRYSNDEKDTGALGSVAYSIVGDTTPAKFNSEITDEVLADGLMYRFTVIEYQGDRPDENPDPEYPDSRIVEHLKAIITIALHQQQASPHKQVQYSVGGKELLEEFKHLCDGKIIAAGDDEARRQSWNRAHLNALKIACLLAVGDNHIDPVIQTEHAEWAVRLLTKNVHTFEEKLDSGEVGAGDDDARSKKVMDLIKKIYNGEFDKNLHPEVVRLRAAREILIPRRLLSQRTANVKAFKNHPLGATAALDKTLDHLTKCGVVERLNGSGGEKVPWVNNSLPKGDYYRLLDADPDRIYYHPQTAARSF